MRLAPPSASKRSMTLGSAADPEAICKVGGQSGGKRRVVVHGLAGEGRVCWTLTWGSSQGRTPLITVLFMLRKEGKEEGEGGVGATGCNPAHPAAAHARVGKGRVCRGTGRGGWGRGSKAGKQRQARTEGRRAHDEYARLGGLRLEDRDHVEEVRSVVITCVVGHEKSA